MAEDARDTGDTLGGEHVFIDHDGIILRIIKRDRLQVEDGTQDGEIRTDPVQGKAGKKAISSFLLCLGCFLSHKQ